MEMKKLILALTFLFGITSAQAQFQLGSWGSEAGYLFYGNSSQPFAGTRTELLSLCTTGSLPQIADERVLIMQNTQTSYISVFVRIRTTGQWILIAAKNGLGMPQFYVNPENTGYRIYWNGMYDRTVLFH